MDEGREMEENGDFIEGRKRGIDLLPGGPSYRVRVAAMLAIVRGWACVAPPASAS